MPRPITVRFLLAGLALLGASALIGGGALLADPSGGALQMPLTLLDDTPFTDYWLPGMILFTVLGLGSVLAFCGLLARPRWEWVERWNPIRRAHWAWTSSLAVSIATIIWMAVQIALIGYVSFLQPLYGGLGIVLLGLTLLPTVRGHCRAEDPT